MARTKCCTVYTFSYAQEAAHPKWVEGVHMSRTKCCTVYTFLMITAAHEAAERDDPLHYAAGPYESLRKIFGRDARGVFSAPVGNGAHMTQ